MTHEKKIINKGVIDAIIDELITIDVSRDKQVKELNIVTPSIDVIIKKNKFFLYFSKSSKILRQVKGSNKRKARDHLKKLNLKGVKLQREATFPVKKLPDQKSDEATNKIKAK